MNSESFRNSNLENHMNRTMRLVLVDIMKPTVALEYLTDSQIKNIQNRVLNKRETEQKFLDDHSYSMKRGNTFVRPNCRTNANNMSAQSNHHTYMTTFEQSNAANDTLYYTPDHTDASSVDSDYLWNNAIETDDDNTNNNILLNEENSSKCSGTQSNVSTPYRMSESDLQEINDRDNEIEAYTMNQQNADCDDGNNDFNNMNNTFDIDDEHYDSVEDEERSESDGSDFADFEHIITQLTNKSGPQNTDENGNAWRSTEKVFDNICLKNLHNKCNGYELLCRFNHNLPEPVTVSRNLHRADESDIEEAHQLLMMYDKLLLKYWPTFCSFYGRWDWRENLRLSIGTLSLMEGLCNEYNLLSHILDGFMKTGMKYALCVEQIMLELDVSLRIEEQFYAIWQIIIDPRNIAIKSHLEQFSDVMLNDSSTVNVKAITQMLSIQIANETLDIRAFTVNILKRCNVAIFQSIDPAVIFEYILYLRAFDEIGSKSIQLRESSLSQQMR